MTVFCDSEFLRGRVQIPLDHLREGKSGAVGSPVHTVDAPLSFRNRVSAMITLLDPTSNPQIATSRTNSNSANSHRQGIWQ